MSKQTLDQALQDGDHNLVIGLSAWLHQQAGEGPWVLRASTKLEGESWQLLRDANSELKKSGSDGEGWGGALAIALAAKIHAAVTTRYGPAPTCQLRVLAYEKGKSAEYERSFKFERSIGGAIGSSANGGIDATYHYTIVAQLHTSVLASMQTVRDVSTTLATLVANQSQQIATLATTRVVPTAAADVGSSWTSLVGPFALMMAWPMIRQLAEDPKGDRFIDRLQQGVQRLIATDDKPEDAKKGSGAAGGGGTEVKLIGELPAAPEEVSAEPVPASVDRASEAAPVLDAATIVSAVERDPALLRQFVHEAQRRPEMLAQIGNIMMGAG